MTYQNSPNFSGLAAGNYDVVVENIGGCPASYALNPVVINEPNALSGTSTSTNPSCATSVNGSITVSANGGTGPYQYSLNGNAYQPSTTFNGLVAGSFILFVYFFALRNNLEILINTVIIIKSKFRHKSTLCAYYI